MKKTFLAIAVIAASATAALSADDPIAQRKALMQANGGAAGLSAGMMKGEIDYSPAAGKAAITALHATAMTFGDFFPEGSDMGADTKASPKIWEDPAAFEAELAKFQSATAAAVQASGRAGPADLDAFKAAVGPVLGTCKSCHESFQIK
ncbi:c-type cytochrome [Oricola thermophila]|uniref:Cytochrome c n=1 Tax=Oricola thermophila TaxID=2742145 RepID=A0A6N1VHR6_9HYPH|nr:cytochrome c [Oricola thermophila]QKV18689.1 cytochrome c [Oricola thermophila]